MDFAKVNVEVRSGTGKGGSRKVRAAGKVPGVVYGLKVEPITVTFNEKELLTSLDKEKRRNTVLELSITGDGKSEKVTGEVVRGKPFQRDFGSGLVFLLTPEESGGSGEWNHPAVRLRKVVAMPGSRRRHRYRIQFF